jgi:hypothetical protein
MNRNEIEQEYQVSESGIITSPGKFEGEHVFAPYFYDAFLNGMADEDDGELCTFNVTPEDKEQFPELANAEQVKFKEDEFGFVYCWAE